MGSLEKLTANLKVTELKKYGMTRAMLVLLNGWKDLEEHIDSTHQDFQEFVSELECREKKLLAVQESVRASNQELESIRMSIEERKVVLDRAEKEFKVFREEYVSGFDLKEKQLDKVRKLADERVKMAELGEERLAARQEMVERLFENFELEQREFEPIQKSIGEKFVEIKLREEDLGNREKELDGIKGCLERQLMEINSEEEQLEIQRKELDAIKDHLERQFMDINLRGGQLQNRQKELDAVENSLKRRANELESKEEQLELEQKQFKMIQKSVQEKLMDIDSKEEQLINSRNVLETFENSLEIRAKELGYVEKGLKLKLKDVESIQRLTEECRRELEIQEKQLKLKFKDVELIQNSTDECQRELKIKEKQLESKLKDVDAVQSLAQERQRELEIKEKQLELKFKDVESIRIITEECQRELENKEKQLNSKLKDAEAIQILAKECLRELECKEKKLDLKLKDVESAQCLTEECQRKLEIKEKEVESKLKAVVSVQNSIDEGRRELEIKEKELELKLMHEQSIKSSVEECRIEVEIKESQIESKLKDVELMWNANEECKRELEIKEKKISSLDKANECRTKELDSRKQQLDSVKEFTQQCFKEYRLKKKQLKLEEKLIAERSKELDLRKKQLDSVKEFNHQCSKEFHSKRKQLNLKRKRLEEWSKELHSKEEQLTKVQSESAEDLPVGCAIKCSPSDIVFFVTMDGKSLQTFLNQRAENHDSMGDEVSKVLRLSLDPAKLVLDAMEGFYPPHLKNVDVEFEGSVVRSSCILLLEQLSKISPQIQSHIKDEALKLASEWKMKMKAVAETPLEILGFLHLVAAYGLASAYGSDELLSYIELITHCRQAPELCRMLGYVDRVPELIKKLIEEDHYLLAIRFVCLFELEEKFRPASLLEEYLEHIRESAERNDNSSVNESTEKCITALQDVITFIIDHKLESDYSTRNVEDLIEHLTVQNAEAKRSAKAQNLLKIEKQLNQIYSKDAALPRKAQQLQKCGKKQMSSSTGVVLPKPIFSDMAFILANMDGKSLLYFLNSHFEEHKLLRGEVSMALCASFDSAELVLDAVNGFYPTFPETGYKDFEPNVIRNNCVLLLEELMKLSPHVHPRVKEKALKLALAWTEKMKSGIEDPLQIIGFLKLVGCYSLAFAFDSKELVNLLDSVADHHVTELYEVFGISKRIPASTESLHQGDTDASSSDGSFCDTKNLDTCNDVKRESQDKVGSESSTIICCASQPAQMVLDALKGVYYSGDNDKKKLKQGVLRSMFFLLQMLMKVSGDIQPHVQEEALKLAVAWKACFLGPKCVPFEVLVYLQLLAAYRLSTSTDAGELADLLKIVCKSKKALDLFKALGLSNMVPDLIENFIKEGECLWAMKYIFAYDLVEILPPVSILKSHLQTSEELAKQICSEGNNSAEAQAKAIKTEVKALFSAITCIKKFGLDVEIPPEDLEERIRKKNALSNLLFRSKNALSKPSKVPEAQQPDAPTISPASRKVSGRKRCHASVPDRISIPQPQAAKRSCAIVPVENPQTILQSNGYSSCVEQAPQRHFLSTEQDGCYLVGPTPHYSSGSSALTMQQASHPAGPYGLHTSANGVSLPFNFAPRHHGSDPYLNPPPPMFAGTQYLGRPWRNPY